MKAKKEQRNAISSHEGPRVETNPDAQTGTAGGKWDELHDRVERHAHMLVNDISDLEAMKTPGEYFLFRQLESFFRFRATEKGTK